MLKIFLVTLLMLSISAVNSAEVKWHGVLDIRATQANTLESYIDGGYGKFNSHDGANISLAQAGGEFIVEWDTGISAHIVANAYSDKNDSTVGLTEAFLKYRALPNDAGYRWQTKMGIFYPEISLENNAFAWASRNTLNSSAINTWLGEEIRVLGGEVALTRLGKFNDNGFDITVAATAFVNNDPAGALLSWHGWTIGNRQTLWTESKAIPDFRARMPGYDLNEQAEKSDPFLELDDNWGFHLRSKIKVHNKGQITVGYYDNKATPYMVENGQYGWRTRFYHLGASWRLPEAFELTAQYLSGDTLMQSPARVDVVNNDFKSGFVALSKRIKKHRMTIRLEEFSITDNDLTVGDNNNEYGKSATLNYTYRFSKPLFLSVEYNWIDSNRAARMYTNQAIDLTERQWQLAARYFF
ncbi:hypothetical protein [Colwellia sp. Arc7-635]|uniref:hypothetical protein n=1 Tax=Colwellia sp. Arc7-635 TaxID=2497879 RepID=UPI001F4933BD|nr:hypothetical protein [Colwellia sp. Arc7-635]